MGVRSQLTGFEATSTTGRRRRAAEIFAALRGLRPLTRPWVRAAIVEQNLPGVSIAVGMGVGIVWAEGFDWRDVATQTPVTPDTRFNIGTAAPVVNAAAVASVGMTYTGTDSAAVERRVRRHGRSRAERD
jgi:CubicO group peptidase (beta-lactamase class C family)